MRLVADDLWTAIDGKYPEGLLDPVTAFRPDGYFFHPAYKKGWTDGYIRFVKFDQSKKQYGFPTGLLDRVVRFLEEKEWRYDLVDNRTFMPVAANYNLLAGDGSGQQIQLNQGRYSFQSLPLDAMLMHGRGIVKVGTGGGKTTIAAAAINSIGKPTIWLTHRKNLMYQTRERLQNHLGTQVGILGDSECEIREVTVAMMQTIHNILKNPEKNMAAYWYLLQCEVVIGDEGHRLQGDMFYNAFAQIPAKWRYLLTATPPDLDAEGLYLAAQTGGIIYDLPASELIKHGVLVPPRIWFVKYEGPTFPKSIPWVTSYANGIVASTSRNEKIVSVAQQFKVDNKPTVTLVMRINHGNALAGKMEAHGVRVEFINGKTKESDRNKIMDRLFSGDLHNVIAQATIIGEGSDFPQLRAIINATGMKGGGDTSENSAGKDTLQFLGRGLRATAGKSYFDYVDFVDTSHKSLKQASLARIRTLEREGYGSFIKYWEDYTDECMVA